MTNDIRLTTEDIKEKSENALELFYYGIKSNETKRTMTGNLKQFIQIACVNLLKGDLKQRSQQFIDLTREDQTKATQIILAYIKKLRDRTALEISHPDYMNPSSIPNKIKPIKKLLEMNDLGLGWKRIYSIFPELDNTHQGRGYKRNEIQKMLEYSNDITTDFIILAMSSGGFRLGSWDGLTWGSVFPIYQVHNDFKVELSKGEKGEVICGGITIYKGTPAYYTALISLEAWKKLEEIRKIWTHKMNRPPGDSDPLILERFSKPTPLSSTAVKRRIEKVLIKAQLREPLTEGKRRYDAPLTNGFRRFYDKVMMNIQRKNSTLASLVIKERLLGHSGIVKTDRNYFWTDILDLIPEYLSAMNELMINEEFKLKKELENQRSKSDKLSKVNEENNELKTRLNEIEAKVIRIQKYQFPDE